MNVSVFHDVWNTDIPSIYISVDSLPRLSGPQTENCFRAIAYCAPPEMDRLQLSHSPVSLCFPSSLQVHILWPPNPKAQNQMKTDNKLVLHFITKMTHYTNSKVKSISSRCHFPQFIIFSPHAICPGKVAKPVHEHDSWISLQSWFGNFQINFLPLYMKCRHCQVLHIQKHIILPREELP